MRQKGIFLSLAVILTAIFFIFRGVRDSDPSKEITIQSDQSDSSSDRRSSSLQRRVQEQSRQEQSRNNHELADVRTDDALQIPPADVKMCKVDGRERLAARPIPEEDSIFATAGMGEAKPIAPYVSEELLAKRLKSILANDWGGSANLLVNELRAGKGFEMTLDSVEAFLSGKNLFGWPEEQRNWIGDEMMTMLRQEMPQQAYRTFSSIQADVTAPEAMQDYSIQHISHLVADGHVGAEGVQLIRAAYESGNPALASTALISLHRLSETSPGLIPVAVVLRYAEQSSESQDERLKITAHSIIKGGSNDDEE